jgi:hypothetical protein
MGFGSYRYKRRSVLQGLGGGALLLAPLLRAIFQQEEALAQGQSDMRVLIVAMQFGWGLRSSDGNGPTRVSGNDVMLNLPGYFAPLASLKNKMTVVDGLLGTYWANAHDVSYSDILTSAVTPGDDSSRIQGVNGPFPKPNGPSIDFLLAQHMKTSALRLNANYRSFGASCHPLCFDNNGVHLFQQDDPLAKFQEIIGLFPNASGGTPVPEVNISSEKKRALLDYVKDDLKLLQGRVSGDVKERLDIHLQALSEAGSSLGGPGTVVSSVQCVKPTAPSNAKSTESRLNGHLALLKAGFACGTHRVGVLGIGEGLDFSWTDSDGTARNGNIFSNNFHEDVSHWDSKGADSPRRRLCLEGHYRAAVEKIAAFAKSLDAMTIPGENKTLLDKTMIILTGEIADGDHNTLIKPNVIIGGGAAIKTGRYMALPTFEAGDVVVDGIGKFTVYRKQPIATHTEADFWVGVAKSLGLELPKLGIQQRNKGPIILT